MSHSKAAITQPSDSRSAKQAYERLYHLSKLVINFARVRRIARYPDRTKESDVEHSYHLALSAAELAAEYYPELNVGLVTQYSLVHDLVEVYAGDTQSFNLSDEDKLKKERAEKISHDRLMKELPPYTAELLNRYERQDDLEARFVRFVDKILPPVIMEISGTASTFKDEISKINITSSDHLKRVRAQEDTKYQASYPEFPFIRMIRELILDSSDHLIFPVAKSDVFKND